MEKILDWYEGNVVRIMRIGEDVAKETNTPTNFKEIKEELIDWLKLEETPEILENKIEDIKGCHIKPEQSKISNAEQGSTYRLTIDSAI